MLAVLSVFFVFCFANGQEASVGLLDQDPFMIRTCQVALADAFSQGDCSSSVTVLNGSSCDFGYSSFVTARAAEMVLVQKVGGFVLDECPVENADIASLSKFWNVPVFLKSGNGMQLYNSPSYPFLIQLDDRTGISIALTVAKLVQTFNETNVLFAGPATLSSKIAPIFRLAAQYIKNNFPSVNITDVIEFNEANWGAMGSNIDKLRSPTKLIFIDGNFTNLRQALEKMDVISLSRDLYMIIVLCPTAAEICVSSIQNLVYESSLLLMAPSYPGFSNLNASFSQKLQQFYDPARFESHYLTYLACYAFCLGSKEAGSTTGSSVTSRFKDVTKQFGSTVGTLLFDGAANRLPSFSFAWLQESGSDLSIAYTASGTKVDGCSGKAACYTMTLSPGNNTVWVSRLSTKLNSCVYSGGCTSYTPYFIIAAAVAAIAGMVLFFFFYRRQKRLDSYRMHWRIARTSIKVIENKQSSVKGRGTSTEMTTLSSKRRQIPAYALIETTKAEFIVMKHASHIRWTKDELQFLMELKRLNHDNLTNFIGICYNDGDKFFVLHNLVERASLEDYVYDSDFKLDETFKSAFLRDILKGLNYLHKSPVGYHGLLNLSNCLIDANWVLKLTNFGITNLLKKLVENNNLKVIENVPFDVYNNVAPEYLKDVQIGKTYPVGDQQGDVYSFGMILYQVLFRIGPFEKTTYGHKELFQKIVKEGLRPQIDEYSHEEKPLVEVMEQCWKTSPNDRPKVRNLVQIISSFFQATKGNLVDQMIRMNEKHAQNLEQIVAERGAMLVEAQEQSDRLLCEILPPSIAEKLKKGVRVEPRSYDAATVLFCQLVDFMVILTQTKPDQVVAFLNDVFTMFDRVISQHDAYKVETTGETYMVASGVPNENEDRHVFEISEIALEFREASYTYKVTALPNWKLQVRIGYHCGPIAAGVIGLKAPRFCLFGDTVNFASRMQSNCPPNQIQMSESTALMLMPINEYKLSKRGIVNVKGKGSVNTYWLNEHIHEEHGHHFPLPPTTPQPLTPKTSEKQLLLPPSPRIEKPEAIQVS